MASCSDSCCAQSIRRTHNPNSLLLPTGTEYHVDMSRICPQCLDADRSARSAQADVLLREEPDEEEDEEEDDRKDDDDFEDGGYSE